MTGRARQAIAEADLVIGNDTYLAQIRPLLEGKEVIVSRMGEEVDRARRAVALARDRSVAMVSGGDAGIYGMASIVLEVLEREEAPMPCEVVPGVTAANAAAALLGAPLSGDFAVISLSDLLTPIEVIEARLDHAFAMGVPVALYNPKSRGRPHNLALAIAAARRHLAPGVPVGSRPERVSRGRDRPRDDARQLRVGRGRGGHARDRDHRDRREPDHRLGGT